MKKYFFILMCGENISYQELLERWKQFIVWPEQFPLITSKCWIIVIDYSVVSGIKTSVSKMSEVAGNLPRTYICFHALDFESSANKVPQERELQNYQNVDEVNTVEVGETSNPSAKVMSVLQNVPVSSEVVMSEEVQKDHELTVAEIDCVMTRSEEDMDDLNAFLNEKLQYMAVKGLKPPVGDEIAKVQEILSGNVAAVNGHIVGYEGNVGPEADQGRTKSVCPGVTPSANVEGSGC